MKATKVAKVKEQMDRNLGKDPTHPVAGSQAWAEKQKEKDSK